MCICTWKVAYILITLSLKKRLYVTGFAKRGLPHTFNLPTLTIDNFRLVNATDLKFGQQEASTWIYNVSALYVV